jgi:hypothetical protein
VARPNSGGAGDEVQRGGSGEQGGRVVDQLDRAVHDDLDMVSKAAQGR